MQRLLILFILTGLACKAPAQSSYSSQSFAPLQGLVGLWKMETGRGPVYEEWQRVSDTKLSGRSYRISNADTVVFEQLEIYLENGNIIYSPVVRNQNNGQAVPFRLITDKDQRFVFENKEHDFPQRIIYHLISKDSVHARIEGTRNGQERGSDFKYSRVN